MKNKKPLIGVLPLYDGYRQNIWMYPGYTDAIVAVGGIPLVLTLLDHQEDIDELADQLDGFLFTGGQDIHPEEYGQKPLSFLGEFYPPRDFMEKQLLQAIIIRDKPVLGICRGMQLINTALGGTLFQDISKEMERELDLLHRQQGHYQFPVHSVSVKEDSLLQKIVKVKQLKVNSMHHQGVSLLSPRLLTNAISDDGLIEAVEIPELSFGLAVQWHPEFLWQESDQHLKLFEALIDASRANSEMMKGRKKVQSENK